jgi:enamine deaminase RidA (YjgF/YER057c/UK114 family)
MPTHTRIRMFNTKETYPNQSLDNDLCQAVRAGNTVYVRGQVGTDFDGNLIGLRQGGDREDWCSGAHGHDAE